MQRQMLPSRPFSMTASVGACPRALHAVSVAWQATTMPGVQKPHCEPWKPASRSARHRMHYATVGGSQRQP